VIGYYLLGLMLLTGLIHFVAYRITIRYDRLGNLQPIKSLWRYQLTLFIQGLAVLVAAMTMMALVYFLIMLIIQAYEDHYATQRNLYNAFATMSLPDLMLWLWGWIGGYDSGIFPQSTVGKILVVFPPLIGLFSAAWVIFSIWRNMIARKVAEQRGSFVTPLNNHILMCGWNEKARGIIFGLTAHHAPERKKVVVIAEMDDERPLEKYHFPKGMVHYYRGDSADSRALEAAHVDRASAALILAGEKKKHAKNIGSVLTTLAIKRLNPGIFTAAELRHNENIHKFQACDIDALVFAETIIYRLAAQACFNPQAVSWFFDMITHDEHAEYYAMPWGGLLKSDMRLVAGQMLQNKKSLCSLGKAVRLLSHAINRRRSVTDQFKDITPTELGSVLARHGIALVAVYHGKRLGTDHARILVQHTFG